MSVPHNGYVLCAAKPVPPLWPLLLGNVKVWAAAEENPKKLQRLHPNAAALGYKLISTATT